MKRVKCKNCEDLFDGEKCYYRKALSEVLCEECNTATFKDIMQEDGKNYYSTEYKDFKQSRLNKF